MMQAIKLSRDSEGNVLVDGKPYQRKGQIPASGNVITPELARLHSDEIKASEDTDRVMFIKRGFKSWYFDHRREWAALGYKSLDEWIAGEDLTPSNIHYGVQVMDVLYWFFDVDLDALAKIGRKKFEIILPEIESIRKELLTYNGTELLDTMLHRASWLVNDWIQNAIGLSATALSDLRESNKGWEKLSTSHWTLHDLTWYQEEGEIVDEETGEIKHGVIEKERTASDLLGILLGEKQAEIAPNEPLRINVFGDSGEPRGKRAKLTDDRVNWAMVDNDITLSRQEWGGMTITTLNYPADEDVMPPFDPSVERVMYNDSVESET